MDNTVHQLGILSTEMKETYKQVCKQKKKGVPDNKTRKLKECQDMLDMSIREIAMIQLLVDYKDHLECNMALSIKRLMLIVLDNQLFADIMETMKYEVKNLTTENNAVLSELQDLSVTAVDESNSEQNLSCENTDLANLLGTMGLESDGFARMVLKHHQQGDTNKAIQLCIQRIPKVENSVDRTHILTLLGWLYIVDKDVVHGRQVLEDAIKIRMEFYQQESDYTCLIRQNLSICCARLDDTKAAVEQGKIVVGYREKCQQLMDNEGTALAAAKAWANLAIIQYQASDYAETEAMYMKALQVFNKYGEIHDTDVIKANAYVSSACIKTGNLAKAKSHIVTAIEGLHKLLYGPKCSIESIMALANRYQVSKKGAGANFRDEELFQKTKELDKVCESAVCVLAHYYRKTKQKYAAIITNKWIQACNGTLPPEVAASSHSPRPSPGTEKLTPSPFSPPGAGAGAEDNKCAVS